MPRRNLTVIMLVAMVSIACFSQVDQGLYAAKLRQIMNYIHDEGLYVAERRELFEAAAHAMAGTVDKNTEFLAKERKKKINQDLKQEFVGIGVVLMTHEKRPLIRYVLHNQPAFKAGLLPGDVVLAVDGFDTLTLPKLEEFIGKVKGPSGTSVTFTVERRGEDELLEVTVVRALIEVESIKGYGRRADGSWDYMIPDTPRIGYVRIADKFGAKTYDELAKALKAVHDQNAAGLVLDLRNNPGGRLDAAEKICNLFLPRDKIILTTRDRKGRIRSKFLSDGSGPYQKIPLAILINKNSASASEIVAGCLKDQGRAITVGERSYGKGTVQRLFDVDGGRSMLKLTTASFWTPSERQIHRSRDNGGEERDGADESVEWGILPSDGYEVVLDDKAVFRLLRHFDTQDYGAIDGADGLEDESPEDEKPKLDDKSPQDVDSPEKPEDPDAKPGDDSEENTPNEPKKPKENSPFVDIQLQRAIEGVQQIIDSPDRRRAA
jgi:carboxyl-terminal processing protease